MIESTYLPQFVKVYNNIVMFAGHNISTKKHSHHALEVIIPFNSNAAVQIQDKLLQANGLLLRHDIEHATNAAGLMLFICISPECTLGRRLNSILGRESFLLLNKSRVDDIKIYISELITHDQSESEIISYLTKVFIEDITQVERNYPPDRRVASVINHILSNLTKPLNFKELMGVACLSESRLMHLFKKEVGIPIRKFVLWCRLQFAIKCFLEGHTLTRSAHLAGFADLAHFTRTFISAFGITPSQILKSQN